MGDTLVVFSARSGFPGAVPARVGRVVTSNIPSQLFADDVDEIYYLKGYMPGQYDGSSALELVIPWNFVTWVGSQTAQWEARIAKLEADVDNYSTLTYGTLITDLSTEASAEFEFKNSVLNFTNAQADAVQPNQEFVIELKRNAAQGTASPGDAQITGAILGLQ